MKEERKLYLFVGILFVIKLILLPFAQTTHPDAVSRISTSVAWAENPIWITKSIWAPFHFYINGIGLLIWDNLIYTPKIINILFSCFTLLPFYYFTKREFNAKGAFIATVFLGISPILFRYSFMALSETPYLFFLVLALNLLSKGVRQNSIFLIIIAALAVNIAGGIRYEAWIVTFCISLVLILEKHWKYFLVFSLIASLFPIYWLWISFVETGDYLFGFHGTYEWSIETMNNNSNLTIENYLRRVWYFPFSWVIAVGIPTGYLILKSIINSIRNKSINPKIFHFSIPFVFTLIVFEFFAFRGTLLLQHHYIGTLVVLSLPFLAIYFDTEKYCKHAIICGILTIALSYIYNTDGISPLPRLEEQYPMDIVEIIKPNDDKSLILDFIGWEETFFVALRGGYKTNNMVVTVDIKNGAIYSTDINDKFNNYNSGFALLKLNSEIYNYVFPKLKQYTLEETFKKDDVILYKWSK